MPAKRKTKVRAKILIVFTAIMLVSFSLIWGIFNIAVGRYIENSAIAQLAEARRLLETMGQRPPVEPPLQEDAPQPEGLDPVRRNAFRIQANMFPVDESGNLLEGSVSDETAEIIGAIKDKSINIKDLENRQVRTENWVYYVSAYKAEGSPLGDSAYWVIYADVTGLSYFAATINLFLILLVLVMFAVTVFAAFILSNSITGPIKRLGTLAAAIGKGDFTPNDFMFKDQEFADLNTALNKSAIQLGAYDSEQKTFFQNVSHELRTPLMSIKCYAEGISVGLMEPAAASATILEETDRLNDMVKDLLYISKIDNITTVYSAAKTDLIEIVRSGAARQQAVADKKGIRFEFDTDDTPVYCDCVSELISRAVDNLISNAIRYAGSEIVLSARKKAADAVIRVKDDGAGISPEAMPHIFERFYKGADGNHGIGLSIVKSIVTQHNGSVTAENNNNRRGAAFTITLPRTAGR
ncbi:MAG: HAMP domain-containing histidine kinase [Clostridiales bacterium]|jgi:signal transduction histidine kinase|nr:HAMP domain-containing histidine kinase [Clostridiales bacterium]